MYPFDFVCKWWIYCNTTTKQIWTEHLKFVSPQTLEHFTSGRLEWRWGIAAYRLNLYNQFKRFNVMFLWIKYHSTKVLLPTGWKRKWFQAEDRHHYLSPMMEVSSLSLSDSICADRARYHHYQLPTWGWPSHWSFLLQLHCVPHVLLAQVVKGIKALEEVVRLGPEYTEEERQRVVQLGEREAARWRIFVQKK